MMDLIELELISSVAPAETVRIKEIYIPASLGLTGVLSHHLPYLTLIESGEVYYLDKDDRAHYLYIEEGFLEVANNKAVLISDSITRAEDLDRAAIEAGLKKAEKTIKDSLALAAQINPDDLDQALRDQRLYRLQLSLLAKI